MGTAISFIALAIVVTIGIICFGKARDTFSRKYEAAGLVIVISVGLVCLYRAVVNENMMFALMGSFCLFELCDSIYRLIRHRKEY